MAPPRVTYKFVPMEGRPGVYRFAFEAGSDGAGGTLIFKTDAPSYGADIAALLTAAYSDGVSNARAAVRLALGMDA